MATLHRFDPLRDLMAWQQQVNELFGDRLRGGEEREVALSRWAPAVDVYEDAEGLTLSCELPGVESNAVEVKVEGGTLTVSGERKLEREALRQNYHRVERPYGRFLRSFALPPTVDVERIQAENKLGVLRIFLPRREETKPRKITVQVQ